MLNTSNLFSWSKSVLMRLRDDESGATMLEYAVMVALISAAAVVLVGSLGTEVTESFQLVCDTMNGGVACAN